MIKTIQYLVSRFLKHLEPPSLTITFRSGSIWYGPGRISSDFRPKHAMLTLHVWFLHKRLINSTEHNKHFSLLVQEELFDILWHDTRLRIRAEGVNELSVEKHVKDVQQYTFQQLCHLDHAYTEEFLMDEKKRLEEVAFLVWHHMLGREEDVTDPKFFVINFGNKSERNPPQSSNRKIVGHTRDNLRRFLCLHIAIDNAVWRTEFSIKWWLIIQTTC